MSNPIVSSIPDPDAIIRLPSFIMRAAWVAGVYTMKDGEFTFLVFKLADGDKTRVQAQTDEQSESWLSDCMAVLRTTRLASVAVKSALGVWAGRSA